jgi:hypothetical protein
MDHLNNLLLAIITALTGVIGYFAKQIFGRTRSHQKAGARVAPRFLCCRWRKLFPTRAVADAARAATLPRREGRHPQKESACLLSVSFDGDLS